MRRKPSLKSLSLYATPLLVYGALAHADPASATPDASASSNLESVIVTATKLALAEADSSQAAAVVTAEDISAQAQTSVTDALRQLPGIQFEVGGAPGQSIYPRLRGFADSTLYVFDGITMNAGSSGDVGYLLGQLDPTMVGSIQVLRGPRATTYGANTTSGVIDFTTLEGTQKEESVSVEGGSLDWRKFRAGMQNEVALEDGTLSDSLNGSYVASNGTNRFEFTKNGTLVGRMTYATGSIEIGGSFYLTDNDFQSATLIESTEDAPPPYFSVQIPNPDNADTTKAGIVSLWFEQPLTTHLSQKLVVGGAGQDFRASDDPVPNGGLLGTYAAPYDGWLDPNGELPDPSDPSVPWQAGRLVPVYQTPYTYRTIDNNGEADYNLRYRTDTVSAVAGATYLEQNYDESESYAGYLSGSSESEATRSLYGDASFGWLGNRLHTSLGARLDSYTEWKKKATYSLGAAYDLVRGITVYGNYGTSFTQPTLNELYDPLYGNRSTTPEDASTLEAGLRLRQLEGALTASVTLWHSYVDNVITYDYDVYNPRILDGPPYGEYANAEAERSQGAEVEAAYELTSHLTLKANYTRTDAYITNTSGVWQYMIENARNMGNLG
ncbi:MAG: TonB-dependent receptor plug domain-containing protein, partial [Steroidobacteraceae bacterium]